MARYELNQTPPAHALIDAVPVPFPFTFTNNADGTSYSGQAGDYIATDVATGEVFGIAAGTIASDYHPAGTPAPGVAVVESAVKAFRGRDAAGNLI